MEAARVHEEEKKVVLNEMKEAGNDILTFSEGEPTHTFGAILGPFWGHFEKKGVIHKSSESKESWPRMNYDLGTSSSIIINGPRMAPKWPRNGPGMAPF